MVNTADAAAAAAAVRVLVLNTVLELCLLEGGSGRCPVQEGPSGQ